MKKLKVIQKIINDYKRYNQAKNNRYELWRIWNNQKPLILFILLNPSTADDKNDDKTVKKLIGFTKKYDFGGFYIGNLFSYISSSPNPKKFVHNEIKNINHIKRMKKKCKKVIVGWGNLGNNPIWLSDIIFNLCVSD